MLSHTADLVSGVHVPVNRQMVIDWATCSLQFCGKKLGTLQLRIAVYSHVGLSFIQLGELRHRGENENAQSSK